MSDQAPKLGCIGFIVVVGGLFGLLTSVGFSDNVAGYIALAVFLIGIPLAWGFVAARRNAHTATAAGRVEVVARHGAHCRKCGAENGPGAQFCSLCGTAAGA